MPSAFMVSGWLINPTFDIQGPKSWPQNTIQYEGHTSVIITDTSLEWLENKRNKSKP
jgi:hypothetical protein